ncbi:MAG: glycosyltransferase family 2 protein [Verrucomicrobia bacterium]|nr:glycosyltransferase family 2 protein [Verrucomicrobiota bacterium]
MASTAVQPLAADTFIVVPAYNEARVIRGVVAGLFACAPRVVVVDDGSRDATAAEARAAGATVIQHLINRGQGAALRTGMDYALAHGAQVIVTFDSDGQHDPADLPALVGPVAGGECDVTLGSRFLGEAVNMPWIRRLVLRGGIWFTRVVSGIKVTDTHNGLRAFSRRAAEVIEVHQDQMAHASEILDELARRGLRFREVAVKVRYSDYSLQKGQRSTGSVKIVLDFLFHKLWR